MVSIWPVPDAAAVDGADALGPLGGLGLLLASRPPGCLRGGVKIGSGAAAAFVPGVSERGAPRGLLLLSLTGGGSRVMMLSLT